MSHASFAKNEIRLISKLKEIIQKALVLKLNYMDLIQIISSNIYPI